MEEPLVQPTSPLAPFVPRPVVEWHRTSPEVAWREVDATLVFVDLSGFTSMSERLSRLGKVGAEEVTEVIGSTFSELLLVAYEAGGSLLKFGGDALLLLFDGPDHAVRGAHAAGGMRRTLREVGKISTPAGSVTLRMSTGIESGICHQFLVGNTHRELVVAGPLADAVAAMEGEANAGEIVVGPGTAQRLRPSALGPERGEGRRLARVPGAPKGLGAPPITDPGPEVVALVPRAVRDHILSGGHTPEHRQVTVGFLTFGGIDACLAEQGPGEAASRLQTLMTNVQAAADEHGVTLLETDIYPDGGKMILTAGTPQAIEDAAGRMLVTLRSIIDAERSLPVRAGVHHGHVFAGVIGPPYRKTYTVMGDAVNTAARVMARAAWGQVLASAVVRDRSRTRFDLSELEPFQMKGKKRPMVAYVVGERVGRRRVAREGTTAFVGRDRELGLLLEAVRCAVEEGTGTAVDVVGEAGIGKSRFVAEVARRAEVGAHSVACDPFATSTPYFALAALLRSLLGLSEDDDAPATRKALRDRVRRLSPELEPWLPLLAIPLDLRVPSTPEVDALAEDFRPVRLAQTVADLVAAGAEPLLLVVEDVQWLDEASALVLDHLRDRAASVPWVLCTTSRDEEGQGSDEPVIRLGPLDLDACRALVREASDGRLLPQDVTRLAERSGGHPLFLQELVSAGGLEDLPEGVEALVAARIDGLLPPERALLRVLAVLGPRTERSTARRFVDHVRDLFGELPRLDSDSMWGALDDVLEVAGRRIAFREPLYQQVAYEGLPYRDRRALHDRAGRLLERGADDAARAEVLSLHFHEARDADRSWRYSLLAAERAREKYAHGAEATFLRRALDASRRIEGLSSDDTGRVWEDLGITYLRGSRYEPAVEAFHRARRDRTRPVDVARLLRRQAWAQERLGRSLASVRSLLRALRLLDEENGSFEAAEQRVRLRLQLAAIRRTADRHRDALSLADEAAEEAEAVGDRAGLGQAHLTLNIILGEVGDPAAEEHARKALELFVALEDRWQESIVLNNLGHDASARGDWGEALELYRRAREAMERAGHVLGAAVTTNNVGELLLKRGDWDDAEVSFSEALATLRAAGVPVFVVAVLHNLALATGAAGRHEEARRHLDEALATAREAGLQDAPTRIHLADHHAAREDHEAALAEIAGMGDGVRPDLVPLLHRVHGIALAQAGDLEGSEGPLRDSVEQARASESLYEEALALELLVRLGRGSEEDAARAAEILERLGVARTPNVPLPEGSGRGTSADA